MSPFKTNKPKVVTFNEISSFLGKAFTKTSCKNIVINGFQKTRIVSFNRYICTEHDFAVSDVADNPMEEAIPDTDEVVHDDESSFYGFNDGATEKGI